MTEKGVSQEKGERLLAKFTSCLQVYKASTSAKDVRLTVQTLNLRRHEGPEAITEESEALLESTHDHEHNHALAAQELQSEAPCTSWQEYIEVSDSKLHCLQT